jgi:hypothetical protein
VSGERLLQRFAAWKAFSEETSPFSCDLLVHAVEKEDEKALKRSGDGEEDEEDGDDDILRNQEHQITKDP